MQLQNITLVRLSRTPQGELRVAASLERTPLGLRLVWSIVENPVVAVKDGKPVIGPMERRLMTVKEIARRDGLSLNKAAEKRRTKPLECLADLDGQAPLAELCASPEKAA